MKTWTCTVICSVEEGDEIRNFSVVLGTCHWIHCPKIHPNPMRHAVKPAKCCESIILSWNGNFRNVFVQWFHGTKVRRIQNSASIYHVFRKQTKIHKTVVLNYLSRAEEHDFVIVGMKRRDRRARQLRPLRPASPPHHSSLSSSPNLSVHSNTTKSVWFGPQIYAQFKEDLS